MAAGIRFMTTFALTLHLTLGCCWHHAHAEVALTNGSAQTCRVVTAHDHDLDHRQHDHSRRSRSKEAPRHRGEQSPCDDPQNCFGDQCFALPVKVVDTPVDSLARTSPLHEMCIVSLPVACSDDGQFRNWPLSLCDTLSARAHLLLGVFLL